MNKFFLVIPRCLFSVISRFSSSVIRRRLFPVIPRLDRGIYGLALLRLTSAGSLIKLALRLASSPTASNFRDDGRGPIPRCLFKIMVLTMTLALTACATTSQHKSKKEVYSKAVAQKPTASESAVNTDTQSTHQEKTTSHQKQPKPVLVKDKSHRKALKGTKAVRWANHQAQRQPDSYDYSNSLMTYNFEPGALYQVYCAPFDVTDIEFQPGEQITSVAAGDTMRWQVSRTYSGSGANYQEHLLVKPTKTGINNSVVVTTSARTYHLQLHSTKDTYMAAVNWRYPKSNNFVQQYKSNQPSKPLNDLNVNDLNFDYHIQLASGPKPDWMPLAAFTDGNKTYIQFPNVMQQAPVLYVGHSPQSDQIVNYRVEGNYYVVDSVVKEAQLRLGRHAISVVQITKT